MIASFTYPSGVYDLLAGNVNVQTGIFRALLVSSSYTPSVTHFRRNHVQSYEVHGTNYPTGGTAARLMLSRNQATGEVFLTPSVTPVPNATLTAGGLVIYHARGGAAENDELMLCVSFGGDRTVTNFTLTPSFGSAVIFRRAT